MANLHANGLNLRWSLIALAALLSACADVAGPVESGLSPVTPTQPAPVNPGPPATPTQPATPNVTTVDDIYLGTADGQLIARLGEGATPSWSPDGNQIAFVRNGSIRVMGFDGRDEQVVGLGSWPSWSPDGKEIAFTSEYGIEVMHADGSGARKLIPHLFRTDTWRPDDMGVGKPSWSPDGKQIAFEHLGDGDTQPAQIFIMNADGSNPVRLSRSTTRWYAESDPAWSPDGKRVAFWSWGTGITWTSVQDGAYRTLYANFPFVAYGAKPVWSPDGQRVAFNSFRYQSGGAPSIYVIGANGGVAKLLFENAHSAAWSPDGSKIAFVRTVAKPK